MGLFIAVIAFVFVISLSCARVYRRRRSFVRSIQTNAIVGSDSSTGTIVVANSNVQVLNSSDQNRLQFSEQGKNLSPFCKFSIIISIFSYYSFTVNFGILISFFFFLVKRIAPYYAVIIDFQFYLAHFRL